MNLRALVSRASLVLGLGLLWPSAASAAAVWTSTFESGDSSEWMPGTNPKGPDGVRLNFQVLGEQVYTGKFAGKITVHPDDLFGQYKQDRVDIQHQSTLTGEGKESWLSGHYYMPDDANVRNEIAFYESNTSYQNVMDFWVEPKNGGGTTINFGVGFLGATKLWTADFTKAAWHQLAIHVLWSQNAQTGTVDVWFDGAKVVTAAHAKTKADGNTLFFQTGLHRKDPANFDDTIYFDDFVEADSEADAKIGPPISNMGGMGGSSAGGSAGADMGGGGASGAGAGGTATGGAGGASAAGQSAGGVGGLGTGGGGAPAAGAAGASGTPQQASSDSGGCSVLPGAAQRSEAAWLAVALGVTLLSRRSRQRDVRR